MPLQTIVIIVGSLIVMTGIVVLFRSIKEGREDTPTSARIGPLELNGGAGVITILIGGLLISGSILWLHGTGTGTGTVDQPTKVVGDPGKQPSSAHTSSPEPAPASVVITTPVAGQKVTGKSGVRVQGSAPDTDDRKLWLFDHADDNKYYLVSSSPLTVAHGQWMIQDPQVGSATPEDDGHIFVLTLARANDVCATTLLNAKSNPEGDVVFDHLPEGCVEAAHVDIVKDSSH